MIDVILGVGIVIGKNIILFVYELLVQAGAPIEIISGFVSFSALIYIPSIFLAYMIFRRIQPMVTLPQKNFVLVTLKIGVWLYILNILLLNAPMLIPSLLSYLPSNTFFTNFTIQLNYMLILLGLFIILVKLKRHEQRT